MGCQKGLLEYKGEPWLLWQLRQLHKVGLSSVLVVLGFEPRKYEAVLKGFQKPSNMDLTIVKNSQPALGPFSSLMTGFRHLRPLPFEAAFFLPLDVPTPAQEVWEALSRSMQEGIDVAIPSIDKRGGHPVLMAASFLKSLSSLPYDVSDARLDLQIKKLSKKRIAYLPVDDPKVRMNLNTPKDFEDFLNLNLVGNG